MKHLITMPVFSGAGAAGAGAATVAAAGAADTMAAGAGADTMQAGAATQAGGGAGDKTVANAMAAPVTDKKVVAAADWPTDWREKAATGADGKVDAKELDRLKRMDSPVALYRNYRELETRLTSGKGADVPMPTDEAGAKAWREERGIPADPTGYTLPEAVTKALAPEDAPVLASFTAFAHTKNLPPTAVAAAAEWYTGMVETQRADEAKLDKAAQAATEDALRKEWGEGYRDQMAVAKKFSDEAVPGVPWFMARLPNDPAYGELAGKTLGNIPGAVQAFASLGLLKYGDVSFAGGEAAKATENRMAELKNIMDTKFDEWNASPKLREEYYGLLEKQQKRPGQQG